MTKYVPTLLTIKQTAKRLNVPEHFIRTLCLTVERIRIKQCNKYWINLGRLIDYLNRDDSDKE